ncbi:flagellar basal body P-ring formation chaperone FlgA [Pseudoalteromonas sp. MMG022]|uniref:flagellar basal body P-ring formation chaperone FlgA n=1 Tax=Pseudoalteromonas sp. MMG022 TaxID=2909978 RepID=UPI001F009AF2|nr:flagellar basal body P-ring formation chaperone FlgA [Pseudoalteromonas sp. MMG022]MCF6436983.1 flagellar basal body P-ring formation chaperone FlgA [Pseudoalteromonas sp. MMG022]
MASANDEVMAGALKVSVSRMNYLGHDAVKLADIADISGSNQALVEQLIAMELSWPQQGNRLTSKQITQQITAQFPQLPKNWQVTGLNQVFLKQCWQLSEQVLEEQVAKHLEGWINPNRVRLKSVQFIDDTKTLCVPENTHTFKVVNHAPSTLFSKHRMTFRLNSGYEFSAVMGLQLEQLRPVLQREKRKDEPVHHLDIEWRWQRVSHIKLEQRALPLDNLIVQRNLQAGQVLDENNTRIKPVVEQGEQLQFKMQQGALFITGKAKALGEGQVGDEINIMLESSNQAIKAKIVQKGVVIVSQ